MNTGVLLFWGFFLLMIGVGIGGWIQHLLDKRSKVSPVQNPTENKLARAGDLEILRAWRTPASKVWLEMDGARLEDKTAMKPDQQRRLLNLLVDLRPWLSGAPAPESQTAPQAEMSVPLPGKKAGKPVPEVPKPSLKSIIQQINDVLQENLITSVFKDREIQLTEGPDGAVIVQDGRMKYEGIDAVPDPEIKAMIRQAITQWEQTTK
jgi:hypothetical protein